MDRQDSELFFGCLMGLTVFFVVAMAIMLSFPAPTPAPYPVSIPIPTLYQKILEVCNAIDITDNADCHSIAQDVLINRGLLP